MRRKIEPVPIVLPDWFSEALPGVRTRFSDDEGPMRLAVDLARQNVERESGGPFGAVIVAADAGKLIGAGINLVTTAGSSVFHAEILAILTAQAKLGSYAIAPEREATMYVSCEPCAMCLGAIQWSGVRRVVWAATRQDAAALGFDEGPVFPESYEYLELRGIRLEPGPLRMEARDALNTYREQGGEIYNP